MFEIFIYLWTNTVENSKSQDNRWHFFTNLTLFLRHLTNNPFVMESFRLKIHKFINLWIYGYTFYMEKLCFGIFMMSFLILFKKFSSLPLCFKESESTFILLFFSANKGKGYLLVRKIFFWSKIWKMKKGSKKLLIAMDWWI